MATISTSTLPPSKSLGGAKTDNRVALVYAESMSEGSVLKAAKSYLDGDGGLSVTNAADRGLIGDLTLGAVNVAISSHDAQGLGENPGLCLCIIHLNTR